MAHRVDDFLFADTCNGILQQDPRLAILHRPPGRAESFLQRILGRVFNRGAEQFLEFHEPSMHIQLRIGHPALVQLGNLGLDEQALAPFRRLPPHEFLGLDDVPDLGQEYVQDQGRTGLLQHPVQLRDDDLDFLAGLVEVKGRFIHFRPGLLQVPPRAGHVLTRHGLQGVIHL